jgi:hypothetical protein
MRHRPDLPVKRVAQRAGAAHSHGMRTALRLMLYLMSFALGGVLLGYYLHPGWFDVLVSYEGRYPAEARILAAGLAMLLMLIPLSILLRWLQVHRRSREISYSTERGRVAVNLIAVEEALTRALENEDCVKRAHVRVYEDRVKRQVVIESALTFWEVPNITERTRQCQQLLRRRFAELMPEQSAVQVNLSLHRINPRKAEIPRNSSPKLSADSSPERTVTDPFTGVPVEQRSRPVESVGNIYAEPPASSSSGRLPSSSGSQEDELYVGPSYPVEKDDDDGSGSNYAGHAIPAQGPSAPRKKKS